MNKAKFIGKWYDRNPFRRYPAVHLEYEYRGHTYIITDEHNGYSEPMWVKHKNEQDRIDKLIENENQPKKEYQYENSAQAGFDIFYDYITQGET